MARANRFAVVLEFDWGLVDLPGVDDYARRGANIPGATNTYEEPSSAIGAGIHFRYFAPYYIAAQVGGGGLLASGEYDVEAPQGKTTIEFWNVSVEIPILVGGHYPVHDRIQLYGLLGPAILVHSGSYWDSKDAGVPDLEAEDVGVGFQARLGADFYALEGLSFGLEFMYRAAGGVDLTGKDGKTILVEGQPFEGFELDFSGFGMTVGLRLVI